MAAPTSDVRGDGDDARQPTPATPTRTQRLRASLRAALTADPWFWSAFAALWLVSLAPLWVPRFLPLLDLPAHLDAIAVWHRYDDPSWHLREFYKLNLVPFPYWGYYWPAHMLAYLMPVEVASKVYMSLYALGLPLALRATALQFGRSQRLALFAFPLVYNVNFTYGFITFCSGLIPMLYGLTLLDRFLSQPTRARAVGLVVMACGLYLCHVLPWLFFAAASLVLALCHGRPLRALAAGLLELPSLGLALWGARAAAHAETVVATSSHSFHARYETILVALEGFAGRVLSEWPSNWPGAAVLALGVVWLGLLLSAHDETPQPGHAGVRYRLELLWLLSFAAYLLLPVHMLRPVDLWMINGRFVTIVLLFGALLPIGPIAGRRQAWWIALIVVALLYPLGLARTWLAYDRDQAAAFRRIITHVERGRNVLTLMGDGSDPHASTMAMPFQNYHAYTHLLVGGYDAYRLASGFPFAERPERALPAPRFHRPNELKFQEQALAWDYILTKDEPTDGSLFGPDDAGLAPLVDHDGGWRLYRIRH